MCYTCFFCLTIGEQKTHPDPHIYIYIYIYVLINAWKLRTLIFATANSTHTKTHHMFKASNHHPEVSPKTATLRRWMRLQSISLHHYGVQVPFKTTSRLVVAKKSGGFQSRILDGNWWKVTFTIEWLGFRGWQDGGRIWGQIFSGSIESLADDKPKFGGGTVGYFGGNFNKFEWPKMIKFIWNSMNSQLSWPEVFPIPAKNSSRFTVLSTLAEKKPESDCFW